MVEGHKWIWTQIKGTFCLIDNDGAGGIDFIIKNQVIAEVVAEFYLLTFALQKNWSFSQISPKSIWKWTLNKNLNNNVKN